MKKKVIILNAVILIIVAAAFYTFPYINFNPNKTVGEKVDSLNGVYVYYNGGVANVEERNMTADGYNLGLKYQCVEFVKRYYYERFHHRMPDVYGHAKSFYDKNITDGNINPARDLIQYKNPSKTKPQPDDLLIFGPSITNRFGHVAIISKVSDKEVEIVQQNPGPFSPSRETIELVNIDGRWEIVDERIYGWLRMKPISE